MRKIKGEPPGKGITNENLSKKLKRYMKVKKYDAKQLASIMDEPLPYIVEVLKGRRSIQLKTLIKFSIALDVPILEFEDCIKDDDGSD